MIEAIVILVGVALLAWAVHEVAFVVLRRAGKRPDRVLMASMVKHLGAPVRLILALVAVAIAAAAVDIPARLAAELIHGFGIAVVFAVAFLVVRLTYIFDDLLLHRYRTDAADNLRARQVQTQIQVLRRITLVVVIVVSVSVSLLTFPAVRGAGAGLLASAGIIGIVAGVAARPIATNVLAGLQIAISQPIRLDDVVVVQGEWGRIEQIALTYVVVRVWDLRRLVLPISYFIENPFENWTRRTAEILGWVHLEVDYTAPIEALRKRFKEVLDSSSDWDGQVSTLQVTSAGAATVQVRALMSSPDSNSSWNLQCEVREKLIAYLQAEHPGSLPRQRTQLVGAAGQDSLSSSRSADAGTASADEDRVQVSPDEAVGVGGSAR